MVEEKELRALLSTETNGVPDRQLDGLFVKIEQLLEQNYRIIRTRLYCFKT